MSDNIASDHVVGKHTVHGHRLEVHRLTWKNNPGLSFDVLDAQTGDILTEDESFDQYPTAEQLLALAENHSTATEAAAEDGPLTAIRQALATAHDISRLHIRRAVNQDTYVTVTHHHDQPDEVRHATHAAYAATLQEAGWEQAFNVGLLVLIPGIPPADTEPGTHTATWSVTLDGVPDPVDAAYEARGLQHENEITEAVWTVTDATGRQHLIITDDEADNEEDGHGECFEPHLTADGYADCDGIPL